MTPPATVAADWMFLGVRVRQLSAPCDPLVVAEMWLPEGASPPLHVHDDLDDSFYLLEGTVVVRSGDDVALATSGTWVPFPHGVPHTFRVIDGPARAVLLHKTDAFIRFVHAVGHPRLAGEEPATGPRPGIEELDRLTALHGIRNVGDPMEHSEAQRWRELLGGGSARRDPVDVHVRADDGPGTHLGEAGLRNRRG